MCPKYPSFAKLQWWHKNLCGLFELAYVAQMSLRFNSPIFRAHLAFVLVMFAGLIPPGARCLKPTIFCLMKRAGAYRQRQCKPERRRRQSTDRSADTGPQCRQHGVPTRLTLRDINGTKMTADKARLEQSLSRGVFTNLRITPEDGGRFAAEKAEKTGSQMILQDAVFTACPTCPDNAEAAPLWQIRAAQIDYDEAAQDVSYRHSRLEVFGLPVFYLPYMAHASQGG